MLEIAQRKDTGKLEELLLNRMAFGTAGKLAFWTREIDFDSTVRLQDYELEWDPGIRR